MPNHGVDEGRKLGLRLWQKTVSRPQARSPMSTSALMRMAMGSCTAASIRNATRVVKTHARACSGANTTPNTRQTKELPSISSRSDAYTRVTTACRSQCMPSQTRSSCSRIARRRAAKPRQADWIVRAALSRWRLARCLASMAAAEADDGSAAKDMRPRWTVAAPRVPDSSSLARCRCGGDGGAGTGLESNRAALSSAGRARVRVAGEVWSGLGVSPRAPPLPLPLPLPLPASPRAPSIRGAAGSSPMSESDCVLSLELGLVSQATEARITRWDLAMGGRLALGCSGGSFGGARSTE
mmetsp:Transcript_8229/g.32435  ORF Transcript_8229/g.32435 Transcript_8229/m.32435 type:complete len:297 (+) Transcript_8229:346-1236(+)